MRSGFSSTPSLPDCGHARSEVSLGGACPACLLSFALAPQRTLTPGSVVAGRFRITALVGRGGMGEVYRADDLKLGQTVALKFLPADAPHGATLDRLLLDEVRIGRQVAHPNVCRIYDLLEVDDRSAVVMEFVDGEDLASLQKRIGRISYGKALEVARDICLGLDAVHDKGIVHGDLKPGNIMIDGAGRARITDFGLSRVSSEAVERVHAGTVAYMAPEQFTNSPPTSRSDIYALGAVLYEIFTGRRLHDLSDRAAGPVPPPSLGEPRLDTAFEAAILQCLDADAAQRPHSVRAVLARIPGGDVLDAAVAAGETPSPDVVAHSRKPAELSAAAAWSLLAASLAALAAVVVLSDRLTLYGRSDLRRSSEALAERSRQLARDLASYADPRDEGYRFVAEMHRPALTFRFRSSSGALLPLGADGRLRVDDAPLGAASIDVVLTPAGELRRLASTSPSIGGPPVTADRLLREAGVDPGRAAEVRTAWRPPVSFDVVREWRSDDTSVRAAFRNSRVVFFEASKDGRPAAAGLMRDSRLPHLVYLLLLFVALAAGAHLARRNIRLRRVDRRAAWRVAAWTAGCRAAYGVLVAHHPLKLEEETSLAASIAGASILLGAQVWLAYAALEPYVRRHWPQALVGWTRAIQGRFHDPIVGRDILAGALLGLLLRLIDQVRNALPFVAGITTSPSHLAVDALTSLREAVGTLFYCQARAIFYAMFALFVLVLLRTVLRDARAAAAVWLIAMTVVWSRWDSPQVDIPLVAAQMLVVLFALQRIGLLAASATVFTHLVTVYVPLTADARAFYFPQSATATALLAAVIVLAFRAAHRGKPFLADRLPAAV